MTRELKFYYKWTDVIVVREWLIWAHSQTRQVFRVYYKKQVRDSQEKKILKNLLKCNIDSETCLNHSNFFHFPTVINLKKFFNKFFNMFFSCESRPSTASLQVLGPILWS